MPEPVIIATVGSYEELIRALVKHRKRLGLSQLALDDIAGFQDGYCSKIEMGPTHKHGRGLGRMSLPTLLDTLGVRLALVRSPSANRAEERARRAA